MPKQIDRTGHRYGKLTVVKYLYKKDGLTYWLCKCDCGNTKKVSGHALYKTKFPGQGTKSCGCLHAETHRKRRLKDSTAGFKRLLTGYRAQAKQRKLVFTLEENTFRKLVKSQCYYCSTLPRMAIYPSKQKSRKPFIYNGIDRVDNNTGYVKENCVACCKVCNTAKNDMPIERFLEWIQNVYQTSCALPQVKNR